MGFYRKTTLTEARQFIGTSVETMAICEWMVENDYVWLVGDANAPETLVREDGKPADKGIWIEPASGNLMIRTLEGDMRVTYGDWIMRGTAGEFYPCKPYIFAASYEEYK